MTYKPNFEDRFLHGVIDWFGISILSYEEAEKVSVVSINTPKLYQGSEPCNGGLQDLRMGPSNGSQICATCSGKLDKCPGHFGMIPLQKPIYHPRFVLYIVKLLTCVCWNCSRSLIRETTAEMDPRVRGFLEELDKIPDVAARFRKCENFCSILRKDGFFCPGEPGCDCGQITNECQPIIVLEGSDIWPCRKKWTNDFKSKTAFSSTARVITPSEALRVVEKIPMEDLYRIGCLIDPDHQSRNQFGAIRNFHPKNMILRHIFVPPPKERPVVIEPTRGQIQQDYRTKQYISILLANQEVEKIIRNHTVQNLMASSAFSSLELPLQRPPDHSEGPPKKRQKTAGSKKKETELKTVTEKVSKQWIKPYLAAWLELQYHVCLLFEGKCNTQVTGATVGSESVKTTFPIKHVPINMLAGGQEITSISRRFSRKTGTVRQNLNGKRTNAAGRSVLGNGGDLDLDLDQMGIPVRFAREMGKKVKTCQVNRPFLENLCRIGPNHPTEMGARYVILHPDPEQRHREDRVFDLAEKPFDEIFPQGLPLNSSVHRHLRDGDVVFFNRQPTLHRFGIMAFRIRIDHLAKSLKVQLLVVGGYNADFDGDEGNIYVPQGTMAEAEAFEICRPVEYMRSDKFPEMMPKIIQCKVNVLYGLTMPFCQERSGSVVSPTTSMECAHEYFFLDREETMQAIASCHFEIATHLDVWGESLSIPPDLLNKLCWEECTHLPCPDGERTNHFQQQEPMWSGHLIVSLFTPHVNIQRNDFVVRGGQILKGRLTKNNINAISEALFFRYGAGICATWLKKMMSLGNWMATRISVGIGLGDMCLSRKIRNQIKKMGNEAVEKAERYLMKRKSCLEKERIMYTNKAKQELLNVKTKSLNLLKEELEKKIQDNGLTFTIASGSKGDMSNVNHMIGLPGVYSVGGDWIGDNVSTPNTHRYIPHHEIGNHSVQNRGFIQSCYLEGLQPQEFLSDCQSGRSAVVTSSVKTSSVGHQQRRLTRCLDQTIQNYNGCVMNGARLVIPKYGISVDKMMFVHLEDLLVFPYPSFCEISPLLTQASDYLRMLSWQQSMEIAQTDTIYGFIPFADVLCFLEDKAQKEDGGIREHCSPLELWKYFEEDVLPQWMSSLTCSCHHFLDMEKTGSFYWTLVWCIAVEILKHQRGSFLLFPAWRNWLQHYMERAILKKCACGGEPVGIRTAHSLSEPATQASLKSIHDAGNSKKQIVNGMPVYEALLGNAHKRDALVSFQMTIRFKKPFCFQNEIASMYARSVSLVTLESLLDKRRGIRIFLSPVDSDEFHSMYTKHSGSIQDSEDGGVSNSTDPHGQNSSEDLDMDRWSDYVMEIHLDPDSCRHSFLNTYQIVLVLFRYFGSSIHLEWTENCIQLRIACSEETDSNLCLLDYQPFSSDGNVVTGKEIYNLQYRNLVAISSQIAKLEVKGIPNTGDVFVEKETTHNPFSGETSEEWVVIVLQPNLRYLLNVQDDIIDKNRCTSNLPEECRPLFGIQSAKGLLKRELTRCLAHCSCRINPKHLDTSTSVTTGYGKLDPISRQGSCEFNPQVLTNIQFEDPIKSCQNAAQRGRLEKVTGNGGILFGQEPQLGSNSFQVLL